MSRRHYRLIIVMGVMALAVLVFLLTGVGAAGSGSPMALLSTQSSASPSSKSIATPVSSAVAQDSSSQVPGVPAIPVKPTTSAGVAAFTQQDVEAYFNIHPNLSDMFAVENAAPPTVDHVEFVTAGEFSARGQVVPSSRSGADLLCVVTVHGTFHQSGPPPIDPNVPTTVVTFKASTLYFDATTGNLLLNRLGDPVQ